MLAHLKHAWQLGRENFVLIAAITLTVWLPASFLISYLHFNVFDELDELRRIGQEIRVSNAIETMFGPLYIGAILHVLAQSKRGQSMSYGEAFSAGARRSFKLLGTRIVTGFIIFFGFLLLIVPGILWSLRYALTDAVVVLEGRVQGQARDRSSKLTKGKRWQIFTAMVLGSLVLLLAAAVCSTLFYLPVGVMGLEDHFIAYALTEACTSLALTGLVVILFSFYWEAVEAESSPEL